MPFPKNFLASAKTILKRLFRVYAHIYHQHFSEVVQLGEEAHLNTSFKHFIFFVQEFNLIEKRELAPLQELIEKLASKDNQHQHHYQNKNSANTTRSPPPIPEGAPLVSASSNNSITENISPTISNSPDGQYFQNFHNIR